MKATAFAPASIGNVGPGFDTLGLAIDELGERVTVELTSSGITIDVEGRDASRVPRDPERNAAALSAKAMLQRLGNDSGFHLTLHLGLPVSGGLGGSAAGSVAGALAAALAAEATVSELDLIEAALAGEGYVSSSPHLDNIAPSVYGGLTLTRTVSPADVLRLPVKEDWWIVLITPDARIETKAARAILAPEWARSGWVQQMANTASMVHAFASGDAALLRRALDDRYAEPARKHLVPRFDAVKAAALDAGALGCSLSGSGPTMFAMAVDGAAANQISSAMTVAFGDVSSVSYVRRIATEGARRA